MDGADRVTLLHGDGGTTTLADAAAAAAPADVVALGVGCMVAAGWLNRLAQAATADAGVASASALSSGLIVPEAAGAPADWVDDAAARVTAAAARNRPRVLAPQGPCVYLRRASLELVGADDLPDLAAFGASCLARGLCHVLADDVLVMTRGAAPPATSPPAAGADQPRAGHRAAGAERLVGRDRCPRSGRSPRRHTTPRHRADRVRWPARVRCG